MTPTEIIAAHVVVRACYENGRDCENHVDDDGASEILAALDVAGYVIVPKEPTRKMLDASATAIKWEGPEMPKGLLARKNKARLRWRAMVKAAST